MLPHQSTAQKFLQRLLLLVVLGYEGLGGLAGGLMLIIKPNGDLMQMPVEIMHGTFSDFMIPGIILFLMGVLSLIAFYFVYTRKNKDWLWAVAALAGWLIWFITEIIILKELHWLHLMWGLPVLAGILVVIPLIALRNDSIAFRKALLYCGIASSLWYVFINILVPLYYEGYSMVTFTVSELSAVNAPSRISWVLLCIFYPLLFAAFGWGILSTAAGRKALHRTGSVIILYCFFNLYWPPMHMRGVEPSLTDTLHITWAFITVIMMMAIMISGAAAAGNSFRMYTFTSIVLMMVFGILTGMESPNIPVNGPTPMIGVWERINIGLFMLWVILYSFAQLKNPATIHKTI